MNNYKKLSEQFVKQLNYLSIENVRQNLHTLNNLSLSRRYLTQNILHKANSLHPPPTIIALWLNPHLSSTKRTFQDNLSLKHSIKLLNKINNRFPLGNRSVSALAGASSAQKYWDSHMTSCTGAQLLRLSLSFSYRLRSRPSLSWDSVGV